MINEHISGLNKAAELIHSDAKAKGFYDNNQETGTRLMLVVSEISEALEADRKNFFTNPTAKEMLSNYDLPAEWPRVFKDFIKDTHEDEIADAVIRLLDYCAYKGIDLEWHITQKIRYNKTRPARHGKNY